VLELLAENAVIGPVAAAGALLAERERYVAYPADYVLEWARSMLEKLAGQGLVVEKDGHYFPGQ
jgi:hypothetical protein